MEGILERFRHLPFFRERTVDEAAAATRLAELTQELQSVAERKRVVEAAFEAETNQDLIEACILELGALEKRYTYLIRQAKRWHAAAF